jgi:hypothetical protein
MPYRLGRDDSGDEQHHPDQHGAAAAAIQLQPDVFDGLPGRELALLMVRRPPVESALFVVRAGAVPSPVWCLLDGSMLRAQAWGSPGSVSKSITRKRIPVGIAVGPAAGAVTWRNVCIAD